jgi:membrane-bound ClpP family serine protease
MSGNRFINTGGGNYIESVSGNYIENCVVSDSIDLTQSLPRITIQIQQTLSQLQTKGHSPSNAQKQAADNLVEIVQLNPNFKSKLVNLAHYISDAAANGIVGEAAVVVVKLALQLLGIPLP